MGAENRLDLVQLLCSFATEKAVGVSREEFEKFVEQNPNELVDPQIEQKVLQRATSELIIEMNKFPVQKDIDNSDTLQDQFETWFIENEEASLRLLCQSTIREILDKEKVPGDENLTFTDKFLRKVRENSKNRNVANIMKELNE